MVQLAVVPAGIEMRLGWVVISRKGTRDFDGVEVEGVCVIAREKLCG